MSQSEALRHADELDRINAGYNVPFKPMAQAAAELRRLHADVSATAARAHHYACAVDELRAELSRLQAELDDMTAQRDEALRGPWPEWAEAIRKRVREGSGYDGYDDADGVDLPGEVSEHLDEVEAMAERERTERIKAQGEAKQLARMLDAAQAAIAGPPVAKARLAKTGYMPRILGRSEGNKCIQLLPFAEVTFCDGCKLITSFASLIDILPEYDGRYVVDHVLMTQDHYNSLAEFEA